MVKKLAKNVADAVRKNPVRMLLGPFLWAALVAFALSPGILLNLPAGPGEPLAPAALFDGRPFSVEGGPLPSNPVSALVHALVIAALILPGQLVAML